MLHFVFVKFRVIKLCYSNIHSADATHCFSTTENIALILYDKLTGVKQSKYRVVLKVVIAYLYFRLITIMKKEQRLAPKKVKPRFQLKNNKQFSLSISKLRIISLLLLRISIIATVDLLPQIN